MRGMGGVGMGGVGMAGKILEKSSYSTFLFMW
jgi:hypothetical protein